MSEYNPAEEFNSLLEIVNDSIEKKKSVVIFKPRRCGKTTVIVEKTLSLIHENKNVLIIISSKRQLVHILNEISRREITDIALCLIQKDNDVFTYYVDNNVNGKICKIEFVVTSRIGYSIDIHKCKENWHIFIDNCESIKNREGSWKDFFINFGFDNIIAIGNLTE